MTMEKLKELLANGSITQEEFEEMSKNVKPEEPPEPEGDPEEGIEEKIAKAVQLAVDRATNKLGNEKKKLKEDLEKERKKNLTAEELKQVEMQEKEQELERKENEIRDKENRMYAIKALKKAELDDGSEESLEFVDFVLANDEENIDKKVKSLSALICARVKKEVEKTFKESGREPGKGSSAGANDNPWSKESWNLTKQMELELKDPEKAKTLKASGK